MIVLETDSPQLTPLPFRGTRNEPKHLRIIATEIARLKKTDVDTLIRQTYENAQSLFHFNR
jgi:TatD DNase family protein